MVTLELSGFVAVRNAAAKFDFQPQQSRDPLAIFIVVEILVANDPEADVFVDGATMTLGQHPQLVASQCMVPVCSISSSTA